MMFEKKREGEKVFQDTQKYEVTNQISRGYNMRGREAVKERE